MSEPCCPDGCLDCAPVTEALELLARKYAIPLACALDAHGPQRFSDLADHFPGASTSTLSARLDELVAAGLVARTQYDEIPPRVEYELTAEGRALGERLRPLAAWAAETDAVG